MSIVVAFFFIIFFARCIARQKSMQYGRAVKCLLGNQISGISNQCLVIYHSLDGGNPPELSNYNAIPRTQVEVQ